MLKYLSCIRPLNLAIIYLTQVFFFYLFLPGLLLSTPGDVPQYVLHPYIFVFALVTVLITASGYLINDYFDYESDLVNKKSARLAERTLYLNFYWILIFFGFILSLGIAYLIAKVYLAGIYILAVALLFLYSAKWKKEVLIGNVVVATFTAFVVLIIIYAEKDFLYSGMNGTSEILMQMYMYSGFIFLISMVREIVKDIEDVVGDQAAGYMTLPIKYGIPAARRLAVVGALLLLTLLIWWIFQLIQLQPSYLIIVLLMTVIAPVVYLIYTLITSSMSATAISKLCKGIMLAGLVFLVLLRVTSII